MRRLDHSEGTVEAAAPETAAPPATDLVDPLRAVGVDVDDEVRAVAPGGAHAPHAADAVVARLARALGRAPPRVARRAWHLDGRHGGRLDAGGRADERDRVRAGLRKKEEMAHLFLFTGCPL